MKEGKRSYFCNCLYFSTTSLARNLTKLAEEAFAPTGMAPSYAFVLMAVNRVPGISPSAIAEEMHMQPSTITRFLDKLESKELIRRVAEGKAIHVYPTKESERVNTKLQEAWEALYDKYRILLGPEEASKLSSGIIQANERLM